MSSAIAISQDKSVTKRLRDGLAQTVADVTTATSVDDLDGAADAALVALHLGGGNELTSYASKLPPTAELMVVVPTSDPGGMVTALRASDRTTAVLTADRATADTVAAIAKRISGGDVFGLQCLVPEGTEIRTSWVDSYAGKLQCLDEIEQFARKKVVRGKYREAILQCADEMLMNALYIAPREAATEPQATDKAGIAARARSRVRVQYAHTDEGLVLAVRDNYGALRRGALLSSWSKAIRAHGAEAGTAGLGLYLISHASTSLHFSELPGVATECVCSFDTRAAKVRLEEVAFYRETDADRISELNEPPPERTRTAETSATGRGPLAIVLVIAVVVVVLGLLVLLAR